MIFDWDNLRFFLALAQHHTLSKAGASIKVSHTTVFRRIKSFEEKIGVTLFESTPNGYVLTTAGEKLFEKVTVIEGQVEQASRQLAGLDQQIEGTIVLTTTDTIGYTMMPAILAKFKAIHPQITIELKIQSETVSMSKREADIAIRSSSNPPPGLIGRKAGYADMGVFASLAYIEQFIEIDFPNKVSPYQYICLDEHFDFPETRWMKKTLGESANVTYINGMMGMASLCDGGNGLALLPNYIDKFLPRLQKIYQPVEEFKNDIWVLTHKDLINSARIRVTTEFLYHELRQILRSHGELSL